MPVQGDGLSGPWDSDAHLRDYLRSARRAGIERAVIFSVFHSDYAHANRCVGRIVARHPNLFYGFAFVHAQRDRGRIGQLVAEAVQEYGFRGIKLHRHDAPITGEVCEVARAWGLPILYDVVGEVAHVELLARQYPDVPFIIPHLGSFADDWRAQLALIDHLVRHPERVHRHVRRAQVRPAVAGSPPGRPGQDPVRKRRPVAQSGARAAQGAPARSPGRRHGPDHRRQPVGVDLACRPPAPGARTDDRARRRRGPSGAGSMAC